MQNEELQDFDLKLRSMLADAEVKAPSRLWSGISARLDAAGAAARPVIAPFWKWTGAVLAAAAALAAAFLLTGTGDRSSEIGNGRVAVVSPAPESSSTAVEPGSPDDAVLQAAVPSSPVSEKSGHISTKSNASTAKDIRPAFKADDRLADAAPAAETSPKIQAMMTAPAENVPVVHAESEGNAPATVESDTVVNAESEGNAPVHAESTPAVHAESAKAASAEADEAASAEAAEQWSDPFAVQEKDNTRRAAAGPVSLYVDGILGGNDSDFGDTSVPRSRASVGASVPSTTSIREKSVSLYGVPLTFGAGVRIPVLPSLSIGTGLNWSMLTRSFQGTYTEVAPGGAVTATVDSDVLHTMHYIGLPVNFYYGIINGKSMKFYAWGGGMAEYCLSNKYVVRNTPEDIIYKENVDKLQFSAGIGLGVEFRLADRLGLYLDPSARYYFHCNQPKNIHTEKPFMISFEAGLRFNL